MPHPAFLDRVVLSSEKMGIACFSLPASSGCFFFVLRSCGQDRIPGNERIDSQECHPFYRRLGHQQTVEGVFVDRPQAIDGDNMITHDR